MHVLQLFDCPGRSIYVEVVITPLPKMSYRSGLELSRCLLLQDLHGNRQRGDLRLVGEQMDMLRHEDVSGDDQAIAETDSFQFRLER